MKLQPSDTLRNRKSAVRYVYLVTVLFLTLTGFGQMPIFKRYYIADIPDLGWLAQFYLTHYIHYRGAVLILALAAYMIIDYLVLQKRHLRLTAAGYVRGAILAGIIGSGILLVVRNLEGSRFAPDFIIMLDVTHLGLVITFLMVAVYCLGSKKALGDTTLNRYSKIKI
jgi:hypothetical protein